MLTPNQIWDKAKKMMMLLLAGTLICMVGCGKDDAKTPEEQKADAAEMSKEELQKKIEELKPLVIEKRDEMTKLVAASFAKPDDADLKKKKDASQAEYEKLLEESTVYAEALGEK